MSRRRLTAVNIMCGIRIRTTVSVAAALAVLLPGVLGAAPRAVAAPTSKPPWYAGLLAAVTARGDLVLVNPDTGATVRTLISHELAPDLARPTVGIAWDARAGIVYFDRSGCTVWRHDVRTGRSARLAAGRAPVISPDGRRVAVRGCADGALGWLSIVAAKSGIAMRTQRLMAVEDEQGFCCTIADVAWRRDGDVLIVTVGSDFGSSSHLIDLRRPVRDITDSPPVPVRIGPGEYLTDTEYVGGRLVLSAICCPHRAPPRSARLAIRSPSSGQVTSLVTLPRAELLVLAARGDGRLRYLRKGLNGGSGGLWALDRLSGVPRRVGGSFRTIAW